MSRETQPSTRQPNTTRPGNADLPPEYRGLKRPTPDGLYEDNSGWMAVFGLLWLLGTGVVLWICLRAFYAADPAIPPDTRPLYIYWGAGILCGAVGLWFTYRGLKAIVHILRLRSGGIPAQAMVFDRWHGRDPEDDGTYCIAYVFEATDSNGAPQRITRAERSLMLYRKYQIGDTFTVRYLPDNPTIHKEMR